MSRILKQNTDTTKGNLLIGELGLDLYSGNNRVHVGITGTDDGMKLANYDELVTLAGTVSSNSGRLDTLEGINYVKQNDTVTLSGDVTGTGTFGSNGDITINTTIDTSFIEAGDVISITGDVIGSVTLEGDGTSTANVSFSTSDRNRINKMQYIGVTQNVDLDAIEARVNSLDAAVVLKGTFPVVNGDFPVGAVHAGESWIAAADGNVHGLDVKTNDRVIALVDNASTTNAAHWHLADYSDHIQSVNGKTNSVIVLDADDIDDSSTTNKFVTSSDITNWNNTSTALTANTANWDTAYSWGNHASAGYEEIANKNQTNGYAGLDNDKRILPSALPTGGTFTANVNFGNLTVQPNGMMYTTSGSLQIGSTGGITLENDTNIGGDLSVFDLTVGGNTILGNSGLSDSVAINAKETVITSNRDGSIALIVDQTNIASDNEKIIDLRRAGVSKAYIDKNGDLYCNNITANAIEGQVTEW